MTRDELTDDARGVLDVLGGGGSLVGERTFPQAHRFTRSARKGSGHRVPVPARTVADLVEAGCLAVTPAGHGAGVAKFDVLMYRLTDKGRQLAGVR
jgi:hypothetical protein